MLPPAQIYKELYRITASILKEETMFMTHEQIDKIEGLFNKAEMQKLQDDKIKYLKEAAEFIINNKLVSGAVKYDLNRVYHNTQELFY